MESFQIRGLISLQRGTPLSYWFLSKLSKGKTRDVVMHYLHPDRLRHSVGKSDFSIASAYLVDQSLKKVTEIRITINWKFKKMLSLRALENQIHLSQTFIFTKKIIYNSKKVGSKEEGQWKPYDFFSSFLYSVPHLLKICLTLNTLL